MNTGPNIGGPTHMDERASDFDSRLRQVHAQAIGKVSPRTRVQLRPKSSATRLTSPPRRHAWPLAATCAIALVAGGMFLRHPERMAPAPDTQTVAVANDDAGDIYTALDESPELYLWLASNDTQTLVTEQTK